MASGAEVLAELFEHCAARSAQRAAPANASCGWSRSGFVGLNSLVLATRPGVTLSQKDIVYVRTAIARVNCFAPEWGRILTWLHARLRGIAAVAATPY